MNEIRLAAIVAIAAILGGVVTAIANSILVDANTKSQIDARMVELAIEILRSPVEEKKLSIPENLDVASVEGQQYLLLMEALAYQPNVSDVHVRSWAVDVINASATIGFPEEARAELVSGSAALPDLYSYGFALSALGVINQRQHVENPGQTPLKNGLAKLGFGGMLFEPPQITDDDALNLDKFSEPHF